MSNRNRDVIARPSKDQAGPPLASDVDHTCARRSDDTEASSTRLGASVDPTEARLRNDTAQQPGGEEDLGAIRLEKEVPVAGIVKDEDGAPIPAVRIGGTVGHEATTGEDGRFTLRGFGPNPSFQMNVSKTGYAPLVGRVSVTERKAQALRRQPFGGRTAEATVTC